jgi:hypothetical protein
MPTAASASTIQLLRRAAEVLAGSRRHLSEELAARADKIERLRREEKERCSDGHRMACACVVLAAIDGAEG